MRRFWEDVIRPCFLAAGVRRIVEIGSDRGENTVKLVRYAAEHEGFVWSVDPAPSFDYAGTLKGQEAYYSFLKTTSVNALPRLRDYDAILIDGDHNWYTVYTELQLVLKNTERFPLVFFHDVSWPYDRRDLYYDPDTIPPAWLNAYKISGIDPETDELSDRGFNHKLRNSVSYTNYRCGVLTAVEDFMAEREGRFFFTMIPIMSGLGILLDREQEYPEALLREVAGLTPSEPLARLMRFSDKWFARTHSRMELLTDALEESRKKAAAADEEAGEVRAANKSLRDALEERERQLTEARTETEALSGRAGALESELTELRRELETARVSEKKLGEAEAALDRLRQEETQLREELNASQLLARRLDGKLAEAAREAADAGNERARLGEELSALRGRLKAEGEKLSAAEERLLAGQRQLVRQRELAEENAEAARIHLNSVSYRIGTAFIAAAHSPRGFFRLPGELLRLYREGRKQEQARAEALAAPPPPVREAEKKDAPSRPKAAPAPAKAPARPAAPKAEAKPEPSRYSEGDLRTLHGARVRAWEGETRPLVSVIVLNRDGLSHLRRLTASLRTARFYGNYELIVVDNGSGDGSCDFLREQKDLPLRLIENGENRSFSEANNQGAREASGEYLLFLNNDIEVTDGWLDELLAVAAAHENAGAVGAKLIYPAGIGGLNAGKDLLIQHRGVGFREDGFEGEPFIRPFNLGNGEQAWPDDGEARRIAAVTAAVLLVSRGAFDAVGGFDEGYVYGYEDVDLCLKLHRRGYENYYTPRAMLFHHEFGSQTKDSSEAVAARRRGNIRRFRETWGAYLERELKLDRISGQRLFSPRALTFAFAVTEAGENVSAGDYFTAMELAESLQKLGHSVRYLCRRGEADWYDVGEDTDVLVSMLDAYDLGKTYRCSPGLVTVAWARNWFDRWAANPSIDRYSLVLASSETACSWLSRATGRSVGLFPIAANARRFLDAAAAEETEEERARFGCDYVFTGSYWNDPREIMDILDPKAVPYRFRVFGKNWEQVPRFAPYTGGFVNYGEIPLVYKYTKLVVDDANRVTIQYGAVNSRVYDALAAGRLVLTNGAKGAEETFRGLLPVFRTAEEFRKKLRYYMEHPDEREELTKKLQKFVLEHHTYDIRARSLLEKLARLADPDGDRIAVMIPVPRWSEANSWGDYHFAQALKKCFEESGRPTELRILPEWDEPFGGGTVIVLRGLSVYRPKLQHRNLMWNISHPDDVTPEEYEGYDGVFVASAAWAEHLKPLLRVPVRPLLQCTDPAVFNGPAYGEGGEKRYELLFVGNSRKVFRRILRDLIPTPYDLSVYGTNWHGLIDEKYIKGEYLPNETLGRDYRDAAILLNDHWEDMRQKGFISNRIFDALSAGAFVISDEIEGLEDVLAGCVVTYKDREDLAEKVRFYMEHPAEREKIAARGMALVREKHTFRARADELLRFLEERRRSLPPAEKDGERA